jgi:hypothetical protein
MHERTLPRIVLLISSIVFCVVITTWLVTLFNGLGVLYAAVYTLPILICVLGFILTTVLTVAVAIRNGLSDVKIEAIAHLIPLTLVAVLLVDESEVFKPRRIITAYLKDDLGGLEMVLRNNGTFEMYSIGPFGAAKERIGRYEMKGDTIKFLDPPTSNGYLPTTALIQKVDARVYFRRTATGQFDTTKTFLNYFEIVSE